MAFIQHMIARAWPLLASVVCYGAQTVICLCNRDWPQAGVMGSYALANCFFIATVL